MECKKDKTITSLGKQGSLVVQKSLPLFALWQSDLTLQEFKILDIYLSRIDSHKPENKMVIFEKGELEKVLGIKKINNDDLKERLKHLMKNVVEIPDKELKEGFKLVTLFEEAIAIPDEYGVWQIKLQCTNSAMKYFFNIENLGYLKYKLQFVMSITSKYAYIMFAYLEHNRYRKTWEISVDKLKKMLNCDNVDTYKEFKYFNALVLKKIQKELQEKTKCKYSYKTIKKGRSVVAVKFTVQTLTHIDYVEPNENIIKFEKSNKQEMLWQELLENYNLSKEQINEIDSILVTIPESKLPQSGVCYGYSTIEMKKYHYVKQKTTEIDRRNKKKEIKNKYAYFLKMIKQDAV